MVSADRVKAKSCLVRLLEIVALEIRRVGELLCVDVTVLNNSRRTIQRNSRA